MCRNIRVLYNFQPPTTEDEVRAASLQFVRKVSGLQKPSQADETVFEEAIEAVMKATTNLLHELHAKAPVRTREGEKEKAKVKWAKRSMRQGFAR